MSRTTKRRNAKRNEPGWRRRCEKLQRKDRIGIERDQLRTKIGICINKYQRALKEYQASEEHHQASTIIESLQSKVLSTGNYFAEIEMQRLRLEIAYLRKRGSKRLHDGQDFGPRLLSMEKRRELIRKIKEKFIQRIQEASSDLDGYIRNSYGRT